MRRLFIALLLLSVGISPASFASPTVQIGSPSLPTARPPSVHPRLLLTPDYLEFTLRPRLAAQTESWKQFLSYVDGDQPEADLSRHPDHVTRSLAAAYLVTGNHHYADRARVGLLQMVQELESHPALSEGSQWDALFLDRVGSVALAYDWLYDSLLPADRDALEDVLIRATDVLNDPTRDVGRVYHLTPEGTYRFVSYDHWGSQMVWALAATGLALLGEHEAAVERVDYARALLTGWIIPTLEELSGGSWAAGPTDGFVASWANFHTAAAFWTALGENYFDDTLWWYDRLAYDMFLALPSVQHVGNDPLKAKFWGYPSVIGMSERYSEAALLGRAGDALLTAIFSGTDHAAWMNWFLRQGTERDGVPSLQGAFAVEEFLWYDPEAEGFPPPYTLWYAAGTGQVFLRSSWSRLLDEGITYISFNAGDRFALNQFFDQGNFTVWRSGGDLVVRSGVYSGEGDSDHDANYYGRTIAANVPLICDLAENFDAMRPNRERQIWLNDCGQRSVLPAESSAINPFYRADHRASYETGAILRYAEEGLMTYFRADLTAAYNSPAYVSIGNRPKANEVLREFVYIRDGTLIIHDRVVPADPSFTVMNQLHFNAPPVTQGTWQQVTAGKATLYVTGVAPQNSFNVDDGYKVAGEVVDRAFGQPVGNAYESQPYGYYRLIFVPFEQRDTHYFLTVLIVQDSGQASLPSAAYVQGDGTYGVVIGDWQVMFDDDAGDLSGTTFPASETTPNLLITGLEPLGEYRLTLPDGSRDTVTADDAGTLFTQITYTGEVRLRQR